jgi:hypothetical protein
MSTVFFKYMTELTYRLQKLNVKLPGVQRPRRCSTFTSNTVTGSSGIIPIIYPDLPWYDFYGSRDEWSSQYLQVSKFKKF